MSILESFSTVLSGAQFMKSIIRSDEFKKLFVHIDSGNLEENTNFFFNNLIRQIFDKDMEEVMKEGVIRRVLEPHDHLDLQTRKKMYICNLILDLHERKKDMLPDQLSINPKKLLEAVLEPLVDIYTSDKKMTEFEIYTKIVNHVSKNYAQAFISLFTMLTTPGPVGSMFSPVFIELAMRKINEVFDYEPINPPPPNPRKRKRDDNTTDNTNKGGNDNKKPRN